ncbi:LOW QUALITY PROTEIN: uncharacterized protein LOC129589227 [Paramacrobiotus metropolitanus]|uniref:LOW QUALITY PROTEIN: uncharacterized protein LOC129589227 n=1 Tax=Paramacrobiotus metropolitanus TaxID=2943436 RepID=UPI0024465C32|nr:LOW QUALITY PROTEIN: uncharacterized protein LOC129589227 [Paramacrobiotus metropolitanus]
MSKLNISNVTVLENPANFFHPLAFEITFEAYEDLNEDVEWKIIYVGSAESMSFDQLLDAVVVGPIPTGRHQFIFRAPAPNPQKIPVDDVIGITVVMITASYRGKEFSRVGYYVNIDYADPELKENPPATPLFEKLERNILSNNPRITRCKIDWDDKPQMDGVSSNANSSANMVPQCPTNFHQPIGMRITCLPPMAYSTVKTFGRKSSKTVPLKLSHTSYSDTGQHALKVPMDNATGSDAHVDRLRLQSVEKKWESFFRQSCHTVDTGEEAAFEAHYFIQNLRRSALSASRNLIPFGSVAADTPALLTEKRSILLYSLMKNLRADFSMTASNFRMDFIQQNGVSMLCQALKKLQDEIGIWENVDAKDDVDELKNKMVDEFHCIMCIKFATRDPDGCRGVLQVDTGNLEIICQSLLSPCMQSRIAVMDLLANLIHKHPSGALRPILQQFTTLRLRYAQHDRFRFLVGMSQTNGKLNLLFKASLLNMMNEMLKACPSGNYQVYLQTELEEAGLNVDEVEKTAKAMAYKDESYEDAANVVRQVTLWRENYIMVDKPRRTSARISIPVSAHLRIRFGLRHCVVDAQRVTRRCLHPHPAASAHSPPSLQHFAPGEIKVVIKSITPLQEAEYANRLVSIGAADVHAPPPLPPPPAPYKPPPRPHTYSQNPMHRHGADIGTVSDILVREEMQANNKKAEKNGQFHQRSLTEVPAKFGVTNRKMQNTNLNQRMADKFSGEYNDWRRKRSGDSVDSVDSHSDSAENSSPECRGAVYLVDGVYPAQKTLIDDVLMQFDRAYDALDEQSSKR